MSEDSKQQDVVVASRIRLARNIADFPFVRNCSPDQRTEIEAAVRSGLTDENQQGVSWLNTDQLKSLEHQFLLDLDQLTQDGKSLVASESAKDVLAVDVEPSLQHQSLSIQVNEEDHLCLTVSRNDADLVTAWDSVSELDDLIESSLNYAYDERWGYLTACPANVGTGMRASVIVHLPALVLSGQIKRVLRSLQKIDLNVHGVFDAEATGDFYRISNRATLGSNEQELIHHVTEVVPRLVNFEREAREFLLNQDAESLKAQIGDALERLLEQDLADDSKNSQEDVLAFLSIVRMGIGMDLVPASNIDRVNSLFELVQLRKRLELAIKMEDYGLAAESRDAIERLESMIQKQTDPPEGDHGP